ncbi:acetyltransferase [Vibrio mimicus]
MVTVVVFKFGVMRCQPLRRALCGFYHKHLGCAFLKLIFNTF